MPHRSAPPHAVETHLEMVAASESYRGKGAARTLSEAPPTELRAVLPDLKRFALDALLDEKRGFSGRYLLQAVANTGGNEALRALTEIYQEVQDLDDVSACRRTLNAFEELGDERALPLVLRALDSENDRLRAAAASVLGPLAAESEQVRDVRDRLLGIIRDEDRYVRERAAESLGAFRDQKVKEVLWSVSEDDGERSQVRIAAVRSIGEIGDGSDVPRLAELARERLASARYTENLGKATALAIGTIGTPVAADALRDLLREAMDRDTTSAGYVARGAVEALGAVGSEPAIPLLEEYEYNPAPTSIAEIRFRLDPEASFEHIEDFEERLSPNPYDERLGTLVAEHAIESGTLDLAWEYLEASSEGGRREFVRPLFDEPDAFDDAAIEDLALHLLESPNPKNRAFTTELASLIDPPGREVLERLVETRRAETREAALSLVDETCRSARYQLDLLGVFRGDEVVAERLREAVLTDLHGHAGMTLKTLHEVAPETARSTAWTVLRDDPGDELEAAAHGVLQAVGDEDLGTDLVERFRGATRPDRVGRLAEQLLIVVGLGPADLDVNEPPKVGDAPLYDVLAETAWDPCFHERLQSTHGGYDVARSSRETDDPRRLPVHLYELDPERALAELRTLVRTSDASGLRADALRTLRTFGGDTPQLLADRIDDPAPLVRFLTGRALAAGGDGRATPLLASVARDPEAPAPKRRKAIRSLGELATDDAVEELISLVDSEEESFDRDRTAVRAAAVDALGNVHRYLAREFLEDVAQRDDDLARAARAALE